MEFIFYLILFIIIIFLSLGGAIMIMSIVLFEDEFINIVSISFTALILNELLMVAFEINTWYVNQSKFI